jgi:DNA repair photolyase
MFPIQARGVYIKKEASEDARSMARIERMLPFIDCPKKIEFIDDEGWHRLVCDENLNRLPRHGMNGDEIKPVVVFNQYLYHHTEEERQRRQEQFPELFRNTHYGGYGGWDWRVSGEPEYRQRTGLICQPAYAIHSFWGCHFRCAYCSLGNVSNIYVNLEDWIAHIREGLSDLKKAPHQTLFQWDNGTDFVCFEPEYGGTKFLVDLFAEQPDKYLLLYVGKSNHVDYFLNYDHRGHTVCCWSLSMETQCREAEQGTASMEARLKAARKCQEAGYPVRIRFSPMIPISGWEAEMRYMIQRMFEEIDPEVLTIEPLRFHTFEQLCQSFQPELLDLEFLKAMQALPADVDGWQKSQFPEAMRIRMYRTVLNEVARISPHTPVAMCREKRTVWEWLQDDFDRMGQHPDNYVCNCGTTSAEPNPLLASHTIG